MGEPGETDGRGRQRPVVVCPSIWASQKIIDSMMDWLVGLGEKPPFQIMADEGEEDAAAGAASVIKEQETM